MKVKLPRSKASFLALLFLTLIALSLIIGFLTYPEEISPPRAATTAPPSKEVPEAGVPRPTQAPLPSPKLEPTPSPAITEAEPTAQPFTLEVIGRMVIYTATISMTVEDVEAAVNQIQSIAEGSGGFVQKISISGEERKSGAITIRVPQDRFYDVLSMVERVGNVTDEQISGQDVTEQYIDLNARLRNAEKQEERLLAILEKANTVEDMLKIEKELMRVREIIESIKGQLQYLERRVEYSTISVYLEERAKPPVISNIRVVEIGTTKAVIKWLTDVPSTSLVEYGPTEAYGYEVYDPKPVREHSITITGLKDSTTYHFRVKSTAYGKTSISSDYTFTTKPEPWIKIPDIDWGRPIEMGLWGFLVIAQALITLLVFSAPLLLIVGPPIYLLYKRRVGGSKASGDK